MAAAQGNADAREHLTDLQRLGVDRRLRTGSYQCRQRELLRVSQGVLLGPPRLIGSTIDDRLEMPLGYCTESDGIPVGNRLCDTGAMVQLGRAIEEHIMDVALRAGLKTSASRPVAASGLVIATRCGASPACGDPQTGEPERRLRSPRSVEAPQTRWCIATIYPLS